MATVKQDINILEALLPSTNPAAFKTVDGTNFPVPSLAFDAATAETVYFPFRAVNYGSGNVTARVQWYADTASADGVAFSGALAAITPNSDSQNIEDDAFDTATTATDSHIGTTGQRLHEFTIEITNVDSIAAGDWCMLKLTREVANGSDTMTGDCLVCGLQIEYSDT